MNDEQELGESRVDIPNLYDDIISSDDAGVNMRNDTMNNEQQPGKSRVGIPNLYNKKISSDDAGVNMRNDTMNDEQQSGESIVDTPNLYYDDEISTDDADDRHITMDDEQVAGRYRYRMVPLSLKEFKMVIPIPTRTIRNSRQEKSKSKFQKNKNLKVVHKIFNLQSPMGNTELHVAAMYGKDYEVEKITQRYQNLLTAKNVNGDTALHLAAKAGRIEILKKLLDALLSNFNCPLCDNDVKEAMKRIFRVNNKGNTFLHEAILNRRYDVVNFALCDENHSYFQHNSHFKNFDAENIALAYTNKENKSILYLAIEVGYKKLIDQALAKACPDCFPPGKSIFLAAILKQDQDILETILKGKPTWIHSMDEEGRTLLHYAAFIGYLAGVEYLLKKDSSCAKARDKCGLLPVHFASDGGHVEIVQKLLEDKYCPHPREMLDCDGRTILHLAIQSGNFNVVKHILQSTNHELKEMVKEKDFNGNTPLHLATFHCHPKIVHALTRKKKVELNSTNNEGQTALDLCQDLENPSFRQRLTWVALKSAGVKYAHELGPCFINAPPENTKSYWDQEAPNMDHYKDRISTLILVSTLIVTVTFAAGFTLPGGTDSSDKGKGRAFMLYHTLFKVYILCITVSMYGALSVTITLIWAQLGDLTLAIFALKVVRPILGVTLATLSVAFMAGLHLVISDLKWLATTTFSLCVIFILTLLFVYILLWFPSHSGNIVVRYISYYPFLFLASLVDRDETSGICRPPDSQEKGIQCSQSERVGNSAN